MKCFITLVLGFLAYPLLFVPLGQKFFPKVMEAWIYIYADYLRIRDI